MNRDQRRALDRRLRKIGDQTLPSGWVVTARELHDALRTVWVLRGEVAVDGVITALTSGDLDLQKKAETAIASVLKPPGALGESE